MSRRGFQIEPTGQSQGPQTSSTGQAYLATREGTVYDCPYRWVCLWEYPNFSASGRMLHWSESGTKNLADWNFRDMASAIANRKDLSGAELINVRTFWPDERLFCRYSSYLADLRDYDSNNIAGTLIS